MNKNILNMVKKMSKLDLQQRIEFINSEITRLQNLINNYEKRIKDFRKDIKIIEELIKQK